MDQRLSALAASAGSLFRAHPVLTTTSLASIPLLAFIIPSYRAFLAIGPGGLPYNFLGYMMQALVLPIAHRNPSDPNILRAASADHASARKTYLSSPLPRRQGSPPTIPGFAAPQRQTSQKRDEAFLNHLNAYLAGVAASRPEELAIKGSGLELPTYPAVWVAEGCVPEHLQRATKGEIAHVHPEGSAHVVLSLNDAEEVLEKGWGMLHRLAKRVGNLPLGYVFLYAPRDEADEVVWRRIVDAAVAYGLE